MSLLPMDGSWMKQFGPQEAPEDHPGVEEMNRQKAYLPILKGPGMPETPPRMTLPNERATPYVPPAAPPVVNPGGQTMPARAKAYGVTSGFDTGKLNDLNYHSPKYDLGRAINDIGAAEFKAGTGQAKLLSALQNNPFFKNARVEGDKLFYTGQQGQPVTIDFVKGINSDHPELNYLTSDNGGGASPAAPTTPTSPFPGPIYTAGPSEGQDSDFFRNLMAKISDPAMFQKVIELQKQTQDPNRAMPLQAALASQLRG